MNNIVEQNENCIRINCDGNQLDFSIIEESLRYQMKRVYFFHNGKKLASIWYLLSNNEALIIDQKLSLQQSYESNYPSLRTLLFRGLISHVLSKSSLNGHFRPLAVKRSGEYQIDYFNLGFRFESAALNNRFQASINHTGDNGYEKSFTEINEPMYCNPPTGQARIRA